MVTVYHNLDPDTLHFLADATAGQHYQQKAQGLEVAAVVTDTDDLNEAFDRVIHRDGENWTESSGVLSFGDPRGRRSSQEGDVFVSGDGAVYLVLPHGFRALPSLRLPYQPD